jgi:hypothetical protein
MGLPPWAWALILIAAAVFLFIRAFYARFRGVCRRVREDLQKFVPAQYPGVEVLGERMGNLVLRTPDQPELVFELADLYAEVMRLPGMGADPAARQALYRAHADRLLAPRLDAGHPLSLEQHGGYFLPQLDTAPPADALSRELPGTGLHVCYVIHVPGAERLLTPADLQTLGLTEAQLHEHALANLGRDFPAQTVETAAGGEGSAVQFGDGVDAARVLLIPRHLQDGQSVLALIPHRDMLLLLPSGMEADPDRLAEGLKLLGEEHGHYALSTSPLRVTAAGFERVDLPAA